MLLVGVTGGIGSGKSTVARMLAERGAVVIDADVLARRAIDPGTPGHDRVVELFGDHILARDGGIDRDALAALVFADQEARRQLESVVHPEVFRLLMEELDRYRNTDRVVVFDAPLIVETGFQDACDVVVVVSARAEQQIERLMASRGMPEPEARNRIAAQLPLEGKLEVADVVVRNEGPVAALKREVDELWTSLEGRAREKGKR